MALTSSPATTPTFAQSRWHSTQSCAAQLSCERSLPSYSPQSVREPRTLSRPAIRDSPGASTSVRRPGSMEGVSLLMLLPEHRFQQGVQYSPCERGRPADLPDKIADVVKVRGYRSISIIHAFTSVHSLVPLLSLLTLLTRSDGRLGCGWASPAQHISREQSW